MTNLTNITDQYLNMSDTSLNNIDLSVPYFLIIFILSMFVCRCIPCYIWKTCKIQINKYFLK